MPDQPPTWFPGEGDAPYDPTYKERRERLLEQLPNILDHERGKPRHERFLPYLLVRTLVSDRGDRPTPGLPFWESPDIWTTPRTPGQAPDIPPDHGGAVTAGEPQTVYAHVWNLGRAPIAGVAVDFYWFDPSLVIDGAHATWIGRARCELAARGMQGSHKLVKCSRPWVPAMVNGGHECLVVRAYGIGDPVGGNEWAPWLNRHVAQRNISVTDQGVSQQLAASLSRSAEAGTVHLFQVGAAEARIVVRIAAPSLVVSPQARTQLLAVIDGEHRNVIHELPVHVPGGALAPVHPLAAEGAPQPPKLHPAAAMPIVNTKALLRDGPAQERDTIVSTLLRDAAALHAGAEFLPHPAMGEAHVLRLTSTDKSGQLVGGYTLIIR